jgi:TatA/E family protein of Tat protein translocase
MFGSLGMPELLFILVLALLVFGPKRLPQVGRTLGRGLREFRKATSELKRTVDTELSSADLEPTRPTAKPVAVKSPEPVDSTPAPEGDSEDVPEAAAEAPAAAKDAARTEDPAEAE